MTLSNSMSPLIEQHDSKFLCCVKKKWKCCSRATRLRCFVIDEIHLHLQQFFDYKGGSFVESAACNSEEAAKSAFAFMIRSIVSKYKDVVLVLPTCKTNGKDLFALIQSKELSGV